MAKKNYRADNTYLIEGNSGDNPKLMGRALSDGRDSLYLEFYFGKVEVTSKNGNIYQKNERRNEILRLYLWQAPRTPLERRQNKETLEIAKRIRFERGQELLEHSEGYRLKKDKDVDFLTWMWAYYEAYTKADKRHIKRAYNCFVDYLIDPDDTFAPKPDWSNERREKAANEKAKRTRGLKIKARQLTKEMIIGFTEYLQRRFRGDGPHTLYSRFKKIVKAAVEADIIRKNPCAGVVIKIDNGALKKDVLGIDEMRQLIATHYEGENPNIRRAFIFCLYCGVRWCDVKDLTYGNVDYANRVLRFEQAKTKGHSSTSGVVIPLNDGLLNLIGKGAHDDKIFPLPSHTMCLKAAHGKKAVFVG